ncbi:hypothetical protein WJX73_002048 [Symbiochloris irregularis]|uniref:Uncharacterized protein n=1 Tax=Symbiochloris irregularis TaxID=706552 RepID=A0AAW1NMW9_9CHLO
MAPQQFRPGELVEVLLDARSKEWVSATVLGCQLGPEQSVAQYNLQLSQASGGRAGWVSASRLRPCMPEAKSRKPARNHCGTDGIDATKVLPLSSDEAPSATRALAADGDAAPAQSKEPAKTSSQAKNAARKPTSSMTGTGGAETPPAGNALDYAAIALRMPSKPGPAAVAKFCRDSYAWLSEPKPTRPGPEVMGTMRGRRVPAAALPNSAAGQMHPSAPKLASRDIGSSQAPMPAGAASKSRLSGATSNCSETGSRAEVAQGGAVPPRRHAKGVSSCCVLQQMAQLRLLPTWWMMTGQQVKGRTVLQNM